MTAFQKSIAGDTSFFPVQPITKIGLLQVQNDPLMLYILF